MAKGCAEKESDMDGERGRREEIGSLRDEREMRMPESELQSEPCFPTEFSCVPECRRERKRGERKREGCLAWQQVSLPGKSPATQAHRQPGHSSFFSWPKQFSKDRGVL